MVLKNLLEQQNQQLKLRRVNENDCLILWEWANDEQVRAASFSSKPIAWEDHVRWFSTKLGSSNTWLYIAINGNDLPMGQVRFDIYNQEATISISIDRSFRGQGYGHKLIQQAVTKLWTDSDIAIVHAYIKLNNQSSVKAFLKAGFQHEGTIEIQGHQALKLSLGKQSTVAK
jgi:UDP-2,4-diacetamido-2,4,6-trideoxy-beta-L-altropyranose hydrolase